ncbi:enoyl-CoA hydratase/isomerase family protein (plasmid) [Cupriavidus sp. P-10]|uniref:enoyl-CoA hydratase/isomerase family protein n=1 Tax=Cupriavidus sp. P-10 TaxID=2027911 RepID=UPI000E2E4A2E|nr:enoyl-CoA hydratase/isomerase family protein [Cupriavidus sp. P-10]BDB29053.1 enoyl-CoA hydratase/isomerase family protein [Cupriavidus sp. P-10]
MQSEIITLRESRLDIRDGIAEFTHTQPRRRNPLSLALREDYMDMLDYVEGDASIRALIITGADGVFSAGGDLRGMKDRVDNPQAPQNMPDATRRRVLVLHQWVSRLRDLQVPVIAAVDGPAVGAGMGLALVADFVLASSCAFFGMSFAKVGMVPDMAAAYFLPRVVGMATAKDMMLTARRISVEEAKNVGIVHSIYPPETLMEQARQFARRFLDGPGPTLGMTKRMLNSAFESSYAAFVELESNAQAVATTTPFHRDALQRFIAGEPGRFDWDRVAAK